MNLKKLLFVVLGSAIMGIGIAVTIAADLGSDRHIARHPVYGKRHHAVSAAADHHRHS